MTYQEMATEITKTAIETGIIALKQNSVVGESEIEQKNTFNTNQICNFYKETYKVISNSNK